MYIVQRPLFDFNDFFALDESDRLVLVLKTINAEPLIRALQGKHDVGPTGFHARVLWSAMIASVVYRIPTVAELRRNLASNPYLRFVCGMASAADVVTESCSYTEITEKSYRAAFALRLTTEWRLPPLSRGCTH